MTDKKQIQINDIPNSAAAELSEDDVLKITGGLLPARQSLKINVADSFDTSLSYGLLLPAVKTGHKFP